MLAAAWAAETIARLPPDADDQPLRAWVLLALLIAVGWAAGGLHTLARLMDVAAKPEEKLRVWQGILASVAAGVLAFLGVLHWTDWGRMAAYAIAFFGAYAGTLALDAGRDVVIAVFSAMFKAVAERGAKKP